MDEPARPPQHRTSLSLKADPRPDRYPVHPGSKGFDGTSQDAANAVAPDVPRLRRRALLALSRLGSAVVLEVVAASGHTKEQIQPRLSELRRQGLVEPTGERRRNPSGQTAAVLRLTRLGCHVASRIARRPRESDRP